MNNISSKAFSSFKYVYLIAFFALLSGVFFLLTTNSGFESVISGIFILFLSLAGGVLLYKSTTSETRRGIFFGIGFSLIGISLLLIFGITGAVEFGNPI